MIQSSVDEWNQWRKDAPLVRPDLSGVNLKDADLRGINLRYADLVSARLDGADLTGANLMYSHLTNTHFERAELVRSMFFGAVGGEPQFLESNLSYAKMTGAHLGATNMENALLEGADLGDTDFTYSQFDKANLTSADLRGTNLSKASLLDANLDRALLSGTVFGDTSLLGTRNLETCVHYDLSIIDVQTLARSGRLPLGFLRGCGLPEHFIDYLPSLLREAIQFYSCFISYSTNDQPFVERLYADLQSKGVRCWFAPEDLKIGDKFRQRIDESIRLHDKLLLVLSEKSIASPWVEDEVEAALERERRERKSVLFPISIDESVSKSEIAWAASLRRARHIGDFKDWKSHDAYQKAFERLLRDLKAEIQ